MTARCLRAEKHGFPVGKQDFWLASERQHGTRLHDKQEDRALAVSAEKHGFPVGKEDFRLGSKGQRCLTLSGREQMRTRIQALNGWRVEAAGISSPANNFLGDMKIQAEK
jgi:hypothetical protein